MNKRIYSILLIVVFTFSLVILSAMTIKRSVRSLKEHIKDVLKQEQTLDVDLVEGVLKDHLYLRVPFIEAAGFTQKALGRHLSNDMQFFMADDGLIHMRREESSFDDLQKSIGILADVLKEKRIPFLVCQIAERAAYGDCYARYIDAPSLEYIEPIRKTALDRGALYLDYASVLKGRNFEAQDIFFKTDIHYKTECEFAILQEVVNLLERETDIVFMDKSTVLDLNNYSTESYPFLGNLASSSGQFYAGTDTFRYYLPLYKTDMKLINPSGNINKQGTFEQVCMNGYRDQKPSVRLYRVTDYMQWPSPFYTITNNLVDSNNILVIGCSMSMRTMAYLSLLCHQITVLDPRSFGGTDYMNKVLNTQALDAVICFPSYNLLGGIGVCAPFT